MRLTHWTASLAVALSLTAVAAAQPAVFEQKPEVAPAVPAGTKEVPRDSFVTLPGFQVELLYTVPKATQGSWVCIATDNKGRLIASDEGRGGNKADKGLYRITPAPIGSDQPTKVEKLNVAMTGAQGLLYAFDSLYVVANGGPGSGLYRLRDTDGDDQYDEVKKLKDFAGGGEHGPHAVRLSPDGKSLYVIAGNHTKPPEKFDASRNVANWDEDLLLPRQWDARGHARGILAPGGWVAITDPEGKTWEMFSNGYRNAYDMDFNADGELFVYDADMEWDMGTPWYRPTRVSHASSGSEFGWRSGTGKWPAYYPDSLPAMVDIGPGSPVGVTFGYGAKFPAKYQKALYILDWTFGTIYALHIEPDGASYRATKEEFLSRTPLPLTDATIGADGAMYFAMGGRNTDSALYRVTYTGNDSTDPADAKDKEGRELRALRQEIEQYHVKKADEATIHGLLLTNLRHEDRFIRYAARVALEHQDLQKFVANLTKSQDEEINLQGGIVIARQADARWNEELRRTLARLEWDSLTERQQLDLLRVYSLSFIRHGQPTQEERQAVLKQIDDKFPAKSDALNKELAAVLVYLNSPTVIDKCLKLLAEESKQTPEEMSELLKRNAGYGGTIAQMLANLPEIQKIHYAFVLRNMRYGWTIPQRQEYFDWLNKAVQRTGGASYVGFIENIRKEALENASPAEKAALTSTTPPPKPVNLPQPEGPGKDWTLAEVVNLTASGLKERDFEHGKRAFAASRCVVCHRFDGEGGATGPDLTNVAGRFSYKDLVEAITDPSKVVSDQYRGSIVVTSEGQTITGRIATDDGKKLTILTDPEDAAKIVEIAKDQVEEVMPAKASLMPKDLLKVLNQDEVLDMLAYMMSRGNPNDPMFRKQP